MKVNDSYEGSWAVRAYIDHYMQYELSFHVDVHQLKKKDPDEMVSLLMLDHHIIISIIFTR